MSDAEDAVARLIDTYRKAVLDADVEALMRLYHPRARVFDAWAVWSYDGAPAWRKAVESWLSSLGRERVRVAFDDLTVTGGKGLRVLSAIVTYAGVSAEGQELRAMQNRITWAIAIDDGMPTIVHEHTSHRFRSTTRRPFSSVDTIHPAVAQF